MKRSYLNVMTVLLLSFYAVSALAGLNTCPSKVPTDSQEWKTVGSPAGHFIGADYGDSDHRIFCYYSEGDFDQISLGLLISGSEISGTKGKDWIEGVCPDGNKCVTCTTSANACQFTSK